MSDKNLLSIVLGWLIAFLYIVTGFVLFKKALKFKNNSFGKMVILSVFGRLIVAVTAIILSVKLLNLDSTTFIVTLFSFYLVFQIMEVIGLKKISIKGA